MISAPGSTSRDPAWRQASEGKGGTVNLALALLDLSSHQALNYIKDNFRS